MTDCPQKLSRHAMVDLFLIRLIVLGPLMALQQVGLLFNSRGLPLRLA